LTIRRGISSQMIPNSTPQMLTDRLIRSSLAMLLVPSLLHPPITPDHPRQHPYPPSPPSKRHGGKDVNPSSALSTVLSGINDNGAQATSGNARPVPYMSARIAYKRIHLASAPTARKIICARTA
jgi:hypothetical protein